MGDFRPISCYNSEMVQDWDIVTNEGYITLHAEIYSARSYEEKIDRACIT